MLAVGVEQGAEDLGQQAQLLQMGLGQGVEPLVAEAGEGEADEALVVDVPPALDEAEVLRPVHEPHGAVVADEEVPGDVGDRRPPVVGVPPDGQEQLVLGRRHVEPGGLLFAEAAEAAQGDPKFQDPGELLVGQHAKNPTPEGDGGPRTG